MVQPGPPRPVALPALCPLQCWFAPRPPRLSDGGRAAADACGPGRCLVDRPGLLRHGLCGLCRAGVDGRWPCGARKRGCRRRARRRTGRRRHALGGTPGDRVGAPGVDDDPAVPGRGGDAAVVGAAAGDLPGDVHRRLRPRSLVPPGALHGPRRARCRRHLADPGGGQLRPAQAPVGRASRDAVGHLHGLPRRALPAPARPPSPHPLLPRHRRRRSDRRLGGGRCRPELVQRRLRTSGRTVDAFGGAGGPVVSTPQPGNPAGRGPGNARRRGSGAVAPEPVQRRRHVHLRGGPIPPHRRPVGGRLRSRLSRLPV